MKNDKSHLDLKYIDYWPTKKEMDKITKALKKVIKTKGKKLRRYLLRQERPI